ncbi:RICIN domain-containing protein [Pseudoalteromonas ardens]|uniref:Uncharacterized protein n=1 Tax=Pseudoalteromonas rubra TaxID=43658 RepID=A0A0L0ET45_9GAMM|nr:RICIN domain-containing protein [Pseudoalteromonas sp. R96]KNC67574.1 hypothetical protein AC626_09895 [Pseudoalteromonas rubra]MDK1310181.1 RICIN domain-containing protein [Pseudoalteromonas sp. R96]
MFKYVTPIFLVFMSQDASSKIVESNPEVDVLSHEYEAFKARIEQEYLVKSQATDTLEESVKANMQPASGSELLGVKVNGYCASKWNSQLFPCSYSSSYKGFILNPTSGGYYTISPVNNPNRCFHRTTNASSFVWTENCDGSSNQKWWVVLTNNSISVRSSTDFYKALTMYSMNFPERFIRLESTYSSGHPKSEQKIWYRANL